MRENTIKPESRINPKQQAFVDYYCGQAAFNATQAYRLAYPLAKTGHEANAARLIAKDNIKQAVEQKVAENKANSELSIAQWRTQALTARRLALKANQLSVVAKYDQLLGQHIGAFELDNRQRQGQLQQAIAAEQVIIQQAISEAAALAKALEAAPDAMAD